MPDGLGNGVISQTSTQALLVTVSILRQRYKSRICLRNSLNY